MPTKIATGTYEYDTTSELLGGFDAKLLHSELEASAITAALQGLTNHPADDRLIIEWDQDLSGADITTRDAVIAAHTPPSALELAKASKVSAIDRRTDELIAMGFTYNSKQFSLALTAQMKMIGTHEIKDNPALVYPINWNTIDDNDVYAIANAADLDGFYLTGVGTLRAHLDSGTALKDSVRAATTVAEVDAVVDNR